MVGNIGVGTVADLAESDRGQAETVWSALDSIQNGLGGGNEVVGGLWVLLVSRASLRTTALPRALNHLGIVVGAAGIVTIVPALEMAGAVFGLGLIAWFVWAGVVMLARASNGATAHGREPAASRGDNLVASRSNAT